MCAIYGRPRWEKSYGEYDATGDWGRALADITTAELARGFEACAKRGDDWMPSAGQFRALCRPPPVSKRPDEREAQYEVCEDCRRRLPYFGYKQSHQGQDRIIGRSATMGFLCNICVPLQPLPYSDRKLPTKSV